MSKTKYVVYHYVDTSGPESGPRPPVEEVDECFDTEAEAKRWISRRRNPQWYHIVLSDTSDVEWPRQHCGNRECNRGPAHCECFEDL